jgi:class 3 adenylate cyclase
VKKPPKPVHNFVPHPIHDAYRDGVTSGTLNAATLFMDISGFTAMTQLIQEHMETRQQGAELMTLRVAAFFTPVVAPVYARGGFVTGFAGDGMTAVFPDGDADSAVFAALAIRQAARLQRRQKTPFGTITISLKQGLALGQVDWQIMGPDEQKTYFYRGTAIDACAYAEHHANQDEIVLDASIMPYLPDKLETEPLEDGFHLLESSTPRSLSKKFDPRPPHPLSLDVAQNFFDRSVLTRFFPGDFSRVATVFISFEGDPATDVLNDFVSATIRSVRQFGGHFVEVDFGDKGGLMLAYFGTPVEHEDNITRALNCVQTLRQEETPLPWRAGVTYGMVYSGLQGSPIRSKFACTGVYVNLASRLMSGAEYGQTLVTDLVAQDPNFAFTELGPKTYKGFLVGNS